MYIILYLCTLHLVIHSCTLHVCFLHNNKQEIFIFYKFYRIYKKKFFWDSSDPPTYVYNYYVCGRSGVMGVWELLSMPAQHSDLVEAVGSRWINAKPSKYAKYIAHFVDKCEKCVVTTFICNVTKFVLPPNL